MSRSSLYCSDIGKMINAPVLHVNGDYPEGKSFISVRIEPLIPLQRLPVLWRLLSNIATFSERY
jgi:hypothetical protein